MTKAEWRRLADLARLTERELSVCELLFSGKTREQIADALEIKPRTVRQHLESIHTKLNVKNRVGVVLRIIQIRDRLAAPADEEPHSCDNQSE